MRNVKCKREELSSLFHVTFSDLQFAFLISLCLLACSPPQQEEILRPRDPWIIRSVLDNQPRMMTLALDQEMYAAYNTETCHLYKLWKGGIHLDGAAYTDVKTVQPTSWGATYWEDTSFQANWRMESPAGQSLVQPIFDGYRTQHGRITILYHFPLSKGNRISIEESPDYVYRGREMHGYVQRFTIRGLPSATRLRYVRGDRKLMIDKNGQYSCTQTFNGLPPQAPSPRQNKASRGKLWMDRSGCNTCHEVEEQTIGPGYRQIAGRYAEQEGAEDLLVQKVKNGGAGNWGEVPMSPHTHLDEYSIRTMVRHILSLQSSKSTPPRKKQAVVPESAPIVAIRPGFGAPLAGIHPAYDDTPIRPDVFRPRVGALAFMPDGSLLVSTWDSIGAIYRLYGVTTGDTNQVRIERIAAGLSEPLGLEVVDGDIFVLQKQELTQLIDHNGDRITDEYKNICNSWDASTDFHEFSYGLIYKDGAFWANLGLAMRLMPHEQQLPDRGRTIRIFRDGRFEAVNSGLRQSNGIGLGVDGEIFISENQGKWVPSCKLIHVQEGVFHGCRLGYGMQDPRLIAKAPAVWLPQDDIGNSPGEPILMKDGPYAGQMLLPEVTHGGIKRIFLEKIDGEYQGCVFRFSQGLGAGVNRLAWGPDGALYTGGVGMNGNWGIPPYQYGLNRLVYNGKVPFEMLEVRSRPDGMEILFTEPLGEGQGEKAEDYLVRQFHYEATERYGGPKLDVERLIVENLRLSEDRRRVLLSIPQLRTGKIIYIRLADELTSKSGNGLWSSEVWYSLNAIASQ